MLSFVGKDKVLATLNNNEINIYVYRTWKQSKVELQDKEISKQKQNHEI